MFGSQERELVATAKAYRTVFESLQGQVVMADLCARCHDDKSTFDANAMQMAFNEGRRSVLLHIRFMTDRAIELANKE